MCADYVFMRNLLKNLTPFFLSGKKWKNHEIQDSHQWRNESVMRSPTKGSNYISLSGFRSVFSINLIDSPDSKAESFYYVNYGSSIFTSKVRQIISVMKT